ncbi:unnamed protein product [Peronospora destructor]|uniref:Transmembrane protein 198 n=1 Tax=Peronospora destructor TaxID=86335 RepID=A0AAV0UZ80_9STRA|nr:unnamed protein product [Peronospora destructor]
MILSKMQPVLFSCPCCQSTCPSPWPSLDSSLRGSSSSSTDGIVNTISDHIQVGPSIVAALAIVGGLMMNTCGYKMLRPTMFACGFLVGGYIVSTLAGIFINGAAGGVILATVINASFGYRIYPTDPTTGLLILAILLGLICGLVAFKVERLAVIVATALLTAIKDYRHMDEDGYYVYDVPKEWWGYLVVMLVVFIFGFFVQIKKTGNQK